MLLEWLDWSNFVTGEERCTLALMTVFNSLQRCEPVCRDR